MNLSKTLILVIFCCLSFSLLYGQKVKGNGNVVTDIRNVDRFNSLEIGGACEVILTQGNRSALKVETDANLQDLVTTEVHDGVLTVNQEKGYHSATKMILHVIVSDLRSVKIHGAAEIRSKNTLRSDQLKIHIGGAGDLDLEVIGSQFSAVITGAGDAKLCGTVDQASFEIRGSGNIDAYCLEAEQVMVDVKGMGSAKVHAIDKLDVNISGMGSVHYEGSPDVNKSISGMGALKRR